jgi:hypothetical protein
MVVQYIVDGRNGHGVSEVSNSISSLGSAGDVIMLLF